MKKTLRRAAAFLFLAGIFMMLSGDFPRRPFGWDQRFLTILLLSWSKLYLVIFMVSFLFFTASGVRSPYGRASRGLFFPAFFLVTTFLFSVLLSQERRMSLEAAAYLFSVLFISHMFSMLMDDGSLLELLWTCAEASLIFLSVKTIAWRLSENMGSAAYLVLNNSWVGKLQISWVLNFFAPFFFTRYLYLKGRRSYLAGLAWAASGTAVFILFSRSGTMIFLCSTLILCAVHRNLWKKWASWCAVLLAGFLFVAAKGPWMSRYVFRSTALFFIDEGIDRRKKIWKDTWDMFLKRPLTGIGLGTYDEFAFSKYGAPYGRLPDWRFYRGGWHAHNMHLHILAETGLIGFVGWTFFLYALFALGIRKWRKGRTPLARALALAYLIYLASFGVLSMTEHLMSVRVHQSLRMNLTFMFLILFALSSIRAEEKLADKAVRDTMIDND